MRRSQRYKVDVFDHIPTLNEVERASTDQVGDNALHTASPTDFARKLLAKMVQMVNCVDNRRLHAAAEAMLDLGDEDDMTWSACRSFQRW